MVYLNKIKAFLEKIINCFVMILLGQAGFMMKFPKEVLEWTMKSAQVEASMDKIFKMHADGALQSRYPKTVQAAIEAKKAVWTAFCCAIKKSASTEK